MRGKRAIFTALALVGVSYAAYPFVTLYQLRCAVRGGDASMLTKLVDWYAVREGIKEDICDMVLEEPSNMADSGRLPAFGAGFVRGVAGSSVDREFTAEKVAKMADPSAGSSDDATISWAFFRTPAHFEVNISISGQTEPVKAEMELAGFRWKVKRIWLPESLLKQGHWAT